MQHRVEQLLRLCLDTTFGTVWRVREDLWRETFRTVRQRYDEHGTRGWHPSVSLREFPPTSLNEFIPMLHGTTGTAGPVVVRGLTPELGTAHPTSFGQIVRPAPIALREMTSPAPDASPDGLTGYWSDHKRVASNSHKPKLDSEELDCLRAWATRRGIL